MAYTKLMFSLLWRHILTCMNWWLVETHGRVWRKMGSLWEMCWGYQTIKENWTYHQILSFQDRGMSQQVRCGWLGGQRVSSKLPFDGSFQKFTFSSESYLLYVLSLYYYCYSHPKSGMSNLFRPSVNEMEYSGGEGRVVKSSLSCGPQHQ